MAKRINLITTIKYNNMKQVIKSTIIAVALFSSCKSVETKPVCTTNAKDCLIDLDSVLTKTDLVITGDVIKCI